jgi:hypothetical protein
MDGDAEVAVLEVRSAKELTEALVHVQDNDRDRLYAAKHLQFHVWHDAAWWNLSDDLSQFFAWIIETRAGTLDETRAFAEAPLSRSDWLYEAAWQMKKLLAVATEGHLND